jgi:hypothetical protein
LDFLRLAVIFWCLHVAAEAEAHGREDLVAVGALLARAEAREQRVDSTGTGTACSMAASMVQRPSPLSATEPE